MVLAGMQLRSVAIVVRNDSAQSLFPFDFARFSRSEINIENVVPDISSLMRSLMVVVAQPFPYELRANQQQWQCHSVL
jgi:hypothetical protein